MSNYHRAWVPGGTYFFTVALAERERSLLVDHIDVLRSAFAWVKTRHPFRIEAIVVLPDHLHAVWALPTGDADFAMRWKLIKEGFSRSLPSSERRSTSRRHQGERGIWQRRFWEHLVRDERDLAAHMDYVHFNPVKHGWVRRAADWQHSSFHNFVARGLYPHDWAASDVFVAPEDTRKLPRAVE